MKKSESVSHSVVSNSWAAACQVPLSMEFSRQEYWKEWVAIPLSRGSSPSRGETWVSCIARGVFTIWANSEARVHLIIEHKNASAVVHRS